MKQFIYLLVACLFVFACKQQSKDYVIFSGKITDKNSDSLVIVSAKTGTKKIIKVDENGAFSDTLKVVAGFHFISDGKEQTTAFFKNGSDLKMTLDTKEFDETVTYSGKGVDESNFLAKSFLLEEEFIKRGDLFKLPRAEFEAKLKSYEDLFNKRLSEKKLDSIFTSNQKERITSLKNYCLRFFEQEEFFNKKLRKGMSSPKFINYENYKGGRVSLDDLKGKYVYIDVWATWCRPCKNEIPFFKEVEKKFHGKNIEFVGISIDKEKDRDAWRKMVIDKELGGIQLIADKNWSSEFIRSYKINGIPRYILLDPEGKIIDAKAPRPSNRKLVEVLESLNI